MPTPDDLTGAGRRAATRPVQMPTIDEIEGRATQRRTRRRAAVAASGLAVGIALIAGAVIFFNSDQSADTVVGPAAADVEPDTAPNDDRPGAGLIGDDDPLSTAGADDPPAAGSVDIELHLTDGLWFSADVVRGDDAATRAEAAAANANDTREVYGFTVWIERGGDAATVSALLESDVFVAITGPTGLLDRLVDVLDSGLLIGPGLNLGGAIPDTLKEFLGSEIPEGLGELFGEGFDPETFDFSEFFSESFDSDGFDLGELFGEGFDPESFDFGFEGFAEGFNGFGDRLEGQLGDLPFSLDDLPSNFADIEEFLDNLDLGELWPDDHVGCLSIKASGDDGGTVSLQIPEDCLDG